MSELGHRWLAFAGISVVAAACATPSNNVALERPVYDTLERLASSGVVDGRLVGTRPMSGREVSRMLSEAHQRLEQIHGTEQIWPDPILYAVADVDTGVSLSRDLDWTVYFKPLVDPEIKLSFLSGPESSLPGLPSRQHALLSLNNGIEATTGTNLYVSFATEMGFGPFSAFIEPVFWMTRKTTEPYPNRAYAKFGVLGLELTAGWENLWWGQAKRGSLALSNNARPLPMLRLTLPEPVLLPWFLSILGPFQIDAFVSQLEEDRDIASPYLAGLRLNLKPHPAVELGLSRTAIFGGEGVDITAWDGIVTMFGAKDALPAETLLVFDVRLTTEYFQVYGETGVEDVNRLVQTDMAYVVGVFIPYVARYFSARLEVADLAETDWYRNDTFASGYTYRGRLLGHPVGGGGREVYGEVAGSLKGSRFRVFGAYQARADEEEQTELHHQVGGSWELTSISESGTGYSAGAEFAYDRVAGQDFESGVGADLFFGSLNLRGRW